MISLVINTCAGRKQRHDVRSHNGMHYGPRAYALQNFILPQAIVDPDIDEVVVVGEWHAGEGYTYVPKPSVYFSSDDALAQRQAGFEAAKGDWLVFQHDDHMLEEATDLPLLGMLSYMVHDHKADVIIPQRRTRLRNIAGEVLPNGEQFEGVESHSGPGFVFSPERSYISGHCAIYRREVLETCPWDKVPVERCWDIRHTVQIRAAGFNIHWSDSLTVWDVEAGSEPWK